MSVGLTQVEGRATINGVHTETTNWIPNDVDLRRPNAARVYDYYLGGACNLEVDREFGKRIAAMVPNVSEAARLNRRFLARAVTYLARNGINQFLDLGSGIPTVGHVHQIARKVTPKARVVYVDNEQIAVEHAKLLLEDVEGTAVVAADLRDSDAVFDSEAVRQLIDWSQPVALLMVAVLHFVPDSTELSTALSRYTSALVPGSAMVISHATPDSDPERLGRAAQLYRSSSTPFVARTPEQIAAFLDGTDIVSPGVVWTPLWRPEPDDPLDNPEQSMFYAGVGHVR